MYSGKIYVRHSFRYAQLLGILHDEVLQPDIFRHQPKADGNPMGKSDCHL